LRFDGKVAFITGAGAGFGEAFAGALAAEGASVVIADIDAAAGERVAGELRAKGGEALAVTCDVADEHSVDAAVAATVERFGGVDVLINNAGLHLTKYNQPFSVLERNEIRRLFDVNVIGTVNCTAACRAAMAVRGGGAVLNIASIAAHLASSPYGVAKLAVRGLTVAFASELATDGIRVNAISPGLMDTPAAMADLPAAMIEDFITNRQLVKRQGRVDDVVSAMLFLCSDESAFVTGETLLVSGGFPLGI
jgi:NAD(P)-dependent dehydrogenase (short-subunit alcohol dehydrogenase family)